MSDVNINQSFSTSNDYNMSETVSESNIAVQNSFNSTGPTVSTTSVAYQQLNKGVVETMDLSLDNSPAQQGISQSQNTISATSSSGSIPSLGTSSGSIQSNNPINNVTYSNTNNYSANYEAVSGDGTSN